jgi:GTP pyrophosphokinase
MKNSAESAVIKIIKGKKMVKLHSHAQNPSVWLDHVRNTRGDLTASLLHRACSMYGDAHSQSSILKGIAIADILLSLGLDNEALVCAILYPAHHNRDLNSESVSEQFGENYLKLLEDVANLESLDKWRDSKRHTQQQLENLRKMLLAIVTDVRAVLILLAERLWQLREAKTLSPVEQIKLANDTFHVFAPLANRLGVWQLKWEIEDLCFRYLQPDIYNEIAKGLASRRQEREDHIQQSMHILKQALQKLSIQSMEITGRVKHIYSIYQKMQRKNLTLDKIYDTAALRILVPSISDCYSVLSALPTDWQQIPEEFDDYIANPKSNGYRSIHVVVVGPAERMIEIQIRTQQMHTESELGVAAHWRYKEGILQTSHYEAKIALLRQVMAWQKEMSRTEKSDSEQKSQDLFADRVYVFTPAGDVIDLPKGATPLDFAYYIHSEVGHRCRGAKIGKSIVPLTYNLKTGDCIEILTGKQPNPSRDWLNPHLGFLKSTRARSKVVHWFRLHEHADNVAAGRQTFERECKKLRLTDKIDIDDLASKFNFKHGEDLFAAIGSGEMSAAMAIGYLTRKSTARSVIPTATSLQSERANSHSGIQVFGVNNLLSQIARCCKPLPGDEIVGYITRQKGVSIHRRDCGNLSHAIKQNKQRVIEVTWGENAKQTLPVELFIQAIDRAGLLRDITALFSTERAHILNFQTQKDAFTPEITIYTTLEVSSLTQLNRITESLQHVPGILKVARK